MPPLLQVMSCLLVLGRDTSVEVHRELMKASTPSVFGPHNSIAAPPPATPASGPSVNPHSENGVPLQ